MLAYEQAASHFEGACRHWSLHVRVTDIAAANCRWFWARRNGHRPAAARASYEQAGRGCQGTGRQELAGPIGPCSVEFTVGVVDDVEIRLLEEALTALGTADSQLRARVLARLAKALLWTRQEDAARRFPKQKAVQVARRA